MSRSDYDDMPSGGGGRRGKGNKGLTLGVLICILVVLIIIVVRLIVSPDEKLEVLPPNTVEKTQTQTDVVTAPEEVIEENEIEALIDTPTEIEIEGAFVDISENGESIDGTSFVTEELPVDISPDDQVDETPLSINEESEVEEVIEEETTEEPEMAEELYLEEEKTIEPVFEADEPPTVMEEISINEEIVLPEEDKEELLSQEIDQVENEIEYIPEEKSEESPIEEVVKESIIEEIDNKYEEIINEEIVENLEAPEESIENEVEIEETEDVPPIDEVEDREEIETRKTYDPFSMEDVETLRRGLGELLSKFNFDLILSNEEETPSEITQVAVEEATPEVGIVIEEELSVVEPPIAIETPILEEEVIEEMEIEPIVEEDIIESEERISALVEEVSYDEEPTNDEISLVNEEEDASMDESTSVTIEEVIEIKEVEIEKRRDSIIPGSTSIIVDNRVIISSIPGSAVLSPVDGIVVESGRINGEKTISIETDEGEVWRFSGFERVNVKLSESIKKGRVLGSIGSSSGSSITVSVSDF